MRIPVKQYLKLLSKYLTPHWHKIVLMSVLFAVDIALQLVNPQILKSFMDSLAHNGSSSSLFTLALLFSGFAILTQVAAVTGSYLSTGIAWEATNALRNELLAHFISLDMGYHKAHTAGEMIERIDGDVDLLSTFFSQMIVDFCVNVLLLAGLLLMLFTIHWLVGTTVILFSILLVGLQIFLRQKAVPLWIKQRELSSSVFGFLSERLDATEDIRANGATMYILRRFLLLLREWFPLYKKMSLLNASMGYAMFVLMNLGLVVFIGVGTYLLSSQSISLGTVYLISIYASLISVPIWRLQGVSMGLQQAEACIARIQELQQTQSSLKDGPGYDFPPGPLSITFEKVRFGYKQDAPIIHDLSLSIPAGSTLGVIGRTGSGKTTLARLLFRFYDMQEGTITIGNCPLKQATIAQLRQQIGLVTQDVQLFHASLRDNLTFFREDIRDEQILSALDNVGLTQWYSNLAEGLDTELGNEGTGVSAGQAQLLAFARVLLSNPAIVILDEASSRLDPATETMLGHALDRLFTQRTGIIIAHRLTTLQKVDAILFLENGRILEYGPRMTLEQNPSSHYARLLRSTIGINEDVASLLSQEVTV